MSDRNFELVSHERTSLGFRLDFQCSNFMAEAAKSRQERYTQAQEAFGKHPAVIEYNRLLKLYRDSQSLLAGAKSQSELLEAAVSAALQGEGDLERAETKLEASRAEVAKLQSRLKLLEPLLAEAREPAVDEEKRAKTAASQEFFQQAIEAKRVVIEKLSSDTTVRCLVEGLVRSQASSDSASRGAEHLERQRWVPELPLSSGSASGPAAESVVLTPQPVKKRTLQLGVNPVRQVLPGE